MNRYSVIFGGGLDDCPLSTKQFLQSNYDQATELMQRQGSPPPFAGPIMDKDYTSEIFDILEENNMDYLKEWLPQSLMSPTPSSPGSSTSSSSRHNSLADTEDEVDIETEDEGIFEDEKDPDWIKPARPLRKVNKIRRSSAGSVTSGDDEDFVSTRKRRRRRRFSSASSVASQPMAKAKITVWLGKLLDSPAHNPRVVQWENREKKVFRINDQEELARLWGEAKSNPEMTYEKFSRAMRYYYRRQELVIVRRKLIYRFGPRAAIWKS